MQTIASTSARLVTVATGQFGSFTRLQANRAGIGDQALHRRVRSGELVRLATGVYVFAACAENNDTRCMAAVLAGGRGAALGMESAAARAGMWNRSDGRIHVVGNSQRAVLLDAFAEFHRATSLTADHLECSRGIPATRAARTVCDLGRVLTSHQIAFVLAEASFLRILDLTEVQEILAERHGHPGSGKVRAALELHQRGCAGTRSRTEDRLLVYLTRIGMIMPLVNMQGSTNVRGIEVDFAWPHRRFVVEVDGSGHVRPGSAEHDAARDEALERAGWTVMRIPARRVWRDLAGVGRDIQRVLV